MAQAEVKKYKVIFDTNIIWSNDQDKIVLVNSAVKEISDFVTKNKLESEVTLVVPRMVTQERIKQVLDIINIDVQKIEKGRNALVPYGVVIDPSVYQMDYRTTVETEMEKLIKESGFIVLETPLLDQATLIKRSLDVTPPFNDKKSEGDKGNKDKVDSGFRDTVIWLTLLTDAENNPDTSYILCTNNTKDFKTEYLELEFKSKSRNKFFHVTDLVSLKEYLDKEFNLKLDLKKKNDEISNRIKEKTGDIMVQFNTAMAGKDVGNYVSLYNTDSKPFSGLTVGAGASKSEKVVGYDFQDLKIDDVRPLDTSSNFLIYASITVIPRYANEVEQPPDYLSIYRTNLFERPQVYSLSGWYDESTNTFTINSTLRSVFG